MHSVAVRTILFSILAGTAGAASAQAPEGEPPPHHAPPPEALAACKSASSGQECSFTAPSGAHRRRQMPGAGRQALGLQTPAPSQVAGRVAAAAKRIAPAPIAMGQAAGAARDSTTHRGR